MLDQIIHNTPESIFAPLAHIMKYALLGDKARALSVCTPDVLAAAENVEVFSRFLMEFFAYMGEKEKAMDWAEITIKRGFINYPYLARHALFLNSIRDEERFKNILNDVKLKWERFQI